jgi:hypothetical protein
MRFEAVRYPSAIRVALELRLWPSLRGAPPRIPQREPAWAATVRCTVPDPAQDPSCWLVDVVVEPLVGGPPAGQVRTLVHADQDHPPIDVVLDRTDVELLADDYRAVVAMRRVDIHGGVGPVAGWTDLGLLRFRLAPV